MVAFEFKPLYYSLLVFLSAAIPGLALGWPLLKKSGFRTVEKLFLCFFLGMSSTPILLFLEGLAGIKFSLLLVIADMAAITAAGLALGVRDKAWLLPAFSLPKPDAGALAEAARKHGPSLLLLLAALLAFWIRVQTYSPIYSELDPYFYVYGTGQIIREGMVPLADDSAWWPEVMGTHRTSPLKMYLEAAWYSLYTGGGAYDNYVLFTTSSWLPPLSAAFVSFGAYLLVASAYGRKYGVFAAFLMAFLPSTIFKMSAGVNEAAPVGMMMLFMSMGALALAFVKKGRAAKLLAAFMFFVAIAGSNLQSVVVLPFLGMVALQAVENFWMGRQSKEFLDTCLYVLAAVVISNFLAFSVYLNFGPEKLLTSPITMPAAAVALAAAVQYGLEKFGLNRGQRMAAVGVVAVLFSAVFFLTPAGNVIRGPIREYLGAVEYKTALERTIAEQNRAGSSFEGEAGFLALVPANHAESGTAAGFIYSLLGALSSFFTWLSGIFFAILDATFRLVAGIRDTTDAKDPSLLFAFMMVALAGLLAGHFSRKGEAREVPSVFLLMLLFTIPIVYVGINKVKFTVYVGMMAVVLASAALAEAEKLARWLVGKLEKARGEKYVVWAFSGLLFLSVWAQAAGPTGYGMIILSKSLEPRYQDDPVSMAPKAAELCEALRQRGVDYSQMKSLCDAGAGPEYASSVNKQFEFNLCWLSQMRVEELFPGNSSAERQRSSDAVTAARFRCNRLGDYWVESMEWIRDNLGADDRLNSWWDYGHWTNYFGQKKTVLRNEHAHKGMIGRVAHDFIIGSTQDLIDSMNYFDSRYVLFDAELIGGSSFGGKYGALNYLGCVHEGNATLGDAPGTSDCEYEHSPERIVIPLVQTRENSCVISDSQQRAGVYAYRLGKTGTDTTKAAYCVGEVTIRTGEKVTATYYLDRKDGNGDLVLSKGLLRKLEEGRDFAIAELVYNREQIWPGLNGTWVDGYQDAKTGFYGSNLYRGFYLGELPGFELVYSSRGGEVKIYRMKNFTGNAAGWVDPAEASRQS